MRTRSRLPQSISTTTIDSPNGTSYETIWARRAKTAHQRELVVGGPAAEDDSVHDGRRQRDYQQQRDVHPRGDEGRRRSERNHAEDDEAGMSGSIARGSRRSLGAGRNDVFLQQETDRIGDDLQQSVPADTIRSEAGLDETEQPALHPVHRRDDHLHDEERDEELDERPDEVPQEGCLGSLDSLRRDRMQKCRMQNAKWTRVSILHFAFCILHSPLIDRPHRGRCRSSRSAATRSDTRFAPSPSPATPGGSRMKAAAHGRRYAFCDLPSRDDVVAELTFRRFDGWIDLALGRTDDARDLRFDVARRCGP